MNTQTVFRATAAVCLWMGCLDGLPSAVGAPIERETLSGRLLWAGSQEPVPGADVRVAGTHLQTKTDDDGRWSVDLPHGRYEVHFRLGDRRRTRPIRLVRQVVPQYKPAIAYLVPSGASEAQPPRRDEAWERDVHGFAPSIASATAPLHVELPDDSEAWPDRIRVGRRADPNEGCRDNPVVAIEEIPLATYVRGVLPPEIGVFRDLPGALETFKAFGVAAASYGVWFRLRYDETDRRTVPTPLPPDGLTWFHIDDTACNQRYSDTRLAIADRAADAIEGQLLTHASDSRRIDKYEYAASCGGLGTRPEHQSEIVADRHFEEVCVGGWCGHTDCAGHEDHPDEPGPDRCLVRGICQWGAAGMAAEGYDYRDILHHYQPNLRVRTAAKPPEKTVALTGFIYSDPADIPGTGIEGARVRLGSLRAARTGVDGRFYFGEIAWPNRPTDLSVEHPDYTSTSVQVDWRDAPITWVSLQMKRSEPDPMLDASYNDADIRERDIDEPACRLGPGAGSMLVGLGGLIGRWRRGRRWG